MIKLRGANLVITLWPSDIEFGTPYYIRIDRVNYSDGSHPEDFPDLSTDPWPNGPDGQGSSLSRIAPTLYGNDVANWQASPPSPATE
ncbi:hypothetical protein ACFL1G_06165 [Planctomycetota bacterium]